MSLKVFLALISVGSIISWISVGMIIFYFDPGQTSFLGFALFYLSLSLGLSGVIFLASDWLRAKIFKKQLIFSRIKTSVRQAILFTVLIIGWIFLKSQNLLQWWNLLLFILILAALEFFFMSSQKRIKYERQDSTTEGTI